MSLIVQIPRLCTERLLLLEHLAIASGPFGVRAHSLILLMSHGDHLFDKRDMAYLFIRPPISHRTRKGQEFRTLIISLCTDAIREAREVRSKPEHAEPIQNLRPARTHSICHAQYAREDGPEDERKSV